MPSGLSFGYAFGWRGTSPRRCSQATQLLSKKCCNGGNTVFHLTGSRFEPGTFRSRDEHVTARPTGWYFCKIVF